MEQQDHVDKWELGNLVEIVKYLHLQGCHALAQEISAMYISKRKEQGREKDVSHALHAMCVSPTGSDAPPDRKVTDTLKSDANDAYMDIPGRRLASGKLIEALVFSVVFWCIGLLLVGYGFYQATKYISKKTHSEVAAIRESLSLKNLSTRERTKLSLTLADNPYLLYRLSLAMESSGDLSDAIAAMELAVGLLETRQVSDNVVKSYESRLKALVKKSRSHDDVNHVISPAQH